MEFKAVVAENLKTLRAGAGLTQNELAEKLHYSDKAVSKWERGESLPDLQVIKTLADMYGVSVDYILNETHDEKPMSAQAERIIRNNRFIITLLAVSLVWLVATVAYVFMRLIIPGRGMLWMAYVAAVPVSCVVLLVFNSIWGRVKLNYLVISALVWSTLLFICLLLKFLDNIWLLFVIGIPAQVIIMLWSRIKKSKRVP